MVLDIVVCDAEVFAHDYIVVFYEIKTNTWRVYHNEHHIISAYLSDKNHIFTGFNVKHYDQFILRAIATGAPPETVKEINDFIIAQGRQGWEHWYIRQNRFDFKLFDLADDTQIGTSLKSIEAHLGQNIVETEVDFNLDRKLTPEEIQSTIEYCKTDVARTAYLLTLRHDYLQGKINLGKLKNIPAWKALSMTNAKITAAFLDAKAKPHYDERNYQYPPNLNLSRIPSDVKAFFEQIHDFSIPSDQLFKMKYDFVVGTCPATVAWGGIHGAIPHCRRSETSQRVIRNYDVASLYPSLMIYCGYTSRNIPSAETYKQVYFDRIQAKHEGDKVKSNTLKLVLNTTYGATLNSYNDLYDPLMARSVCITGQLFMLDLVYGYLAATKTIEIIQVNTDGVMFSIDRGELPIIEEINAEWQQRTHLTLEEDKIQKYIARDVNNYIAQYTNGKIKKKGWLSWGIAPAGAFSINNNYTIVKEAVCDYFIYGTPVEDTILPCDDIKRFQIIAKAGGGYKSVFWVPGEYEQYRKTYEKENPVIDPVTGKKKKPTWKWNNYTGPKFEVQKVNRVYASQQQNLCSLVKVKPDGTVGKIASLPDSILLDNRNAAHIEDIDKSWYVEVAKKAIHDFLPEDVTVSG